MLKPEQQEDTPQILTTPTGIHEVYYLLKEYMNDFIYREHFKFNDNDGMSGFDYEAFEKWASDLYRYGRQTNLHAFTRSIASDYDRKIYMKEMLHPDRINTRFEFLAGCASYLKLTIGNKRWNQLITDIVGSLTLHDLGLKFDYDRDLSLLSDVNRKQAEIDEAILRHNHWLVPSLIYGMMPDTLKVIGNQIGNILSAYQAQVKPRSNKVTRSL